MDATEKVWRKDFNNATRAIKAEWVLTLDDGTRVIRMEHSNEPAVQTQRSLAIVGYARGWMD